MRAPDASQTKTSRPYQRACEAPGAPVHVLHREGNRGSQDFTAATNGSKLPRWQQHEPRQWHVPFCLPQLGRQGALHGGSCSWCLGKIACAAAATAKIAAYASLPSQAGKTGRHTHGGSAAGTKLPWRRWWQQPRQRCVPFCLTKLGRQRIACWSS